MQHVLQFITKLKANNNKLWFDEHKKEYEIAKKEFTELVASVIEGSSKFDVELAGIEAPKTLFRINRDVRFSKDKSPYKTNFGASINPGGKNSMIPGYYLHAEPGKSFLAGGCYMPPADYLNAIRQEIDYNTAEFKKIILNKNFVHYFKELSPEDKLKNVPKGYEKDHTEAELLKFKSYIVVHDISDKQLKSDDFYIYAQNVFKAMLPLNQFLRRAKP